MAISEESHVLENGSMIHLMDQSQTEIILITFTSGLPSTPGSILLLVLWSL